MFVLVAVLIPNEYIYTVIDVQCVSAHEQSFSLDNAEWCRTNIHSHSEAQSAWMEEVC